jgi:LPS-assembly protein
MRLPRRLQILFVVLPLLLQSQASFALPSFKTSKSSGGSAVLKADEIDGDKVTNTLIAHGNVEVTKDSSVIYADEMIYYKDSQTIRGIGNVRVKNIEIGKLHAREVEMKDDFSSGKFFDSSIIFNDGSYLKAPEIDRDSAVKTTLYKSVYSICPNDDIVADNDLAGKRRDMASIRSSKTVIDKEENVMRSKHSFLRLYNVPVLYTPYISIPLPAKDRQSGFLHPSYAKTTNFGLGIKIPYYFNIAPNMDLLTTPQISLTSNQIILGNDFRHLTSYGKYELKLEAANNELKNTQINSAVLDSNAAGISQRTNKDLRWHLEGKGLFDFTENTGLDFDINSVSDINYLRDYRFSYLAYTTSKVNLDYIHKRDYYAIKSVKFQELQNKRDADQEQFVLPTIDTYTESKNSFFSKEKFALTTNITNINPESGLQYRRASFVPEVKIPFNLNGNLIDVNARVQTDLYWLENNFKNGQPDNNYNSTFANYKPDASIMWRLPLIQKSKYNTLILEPIASLVSSAYKRNNSKTVNEDSNNGELGVSNLFISDRISGFDRNESGERISYGLKSSLFNDFGEFGLTVGQSYRISSSTQDVAISGFAENNKSNLVGQALYKATKYFSIFYSFQLNEANYRNDVNQVTASLNLKSFSFNTDYLLLRRNQQNPDEKEQVTISSAAKLSDRWKGSLAISRDLILKRTLSRSVAFTRDGCCTTFGFAVTETNPGSLLKPQRSFSINFIFKNL